MRSSARLWAAVGLLAALLAMAAGAVAAPPFGEAPPPPPAVDVRAPAPAATSSPSPTPSPLPAVTWRRSQARGLPTAGTLRRGVRLPPEGAHHVTWDPVLRRFPNRAWRRWGTDRLVRTLLAVLAEYRRANPRAPRVAVGDLSRPQGGEFGRRFGGLGHMSHQNGLDVDVYYPRRDGLPLRPARPGQVDRRLAQALVDGFVDAGAELVFVGPRVRLRGPSRVVQPLVHHDDHLHVRLPAK